MLLSAIEFLDTLSEKRRFVSVAIASITSLLLISVLAPLLQAHQASIESHFRSSYTSQATQGINESPNAITNAFSQMASDANGAANTLTVRTVSGVMGVASEVTRMDVDAGHGVTAAATFTVHTAVASVHLTLRSITSAVRLSGRTVGAVFGLFSDITNVNALIHPTDHTPTPVIARIRAQQAVIIQSGTKNVVLPLVSDGTGGACDNGNGNGSYPLGWCNAPMDTLTTVPYSSDPINRECTSYVYWYFTAIEGHTNFKAWGNAKYWATSSNYPTHAAPTVGSIAVETAGAYGHLAIVQALPGQNFEGQIVPSGYVLVSEMNYDWSGHFRYSYSPLSKFSTYIYQ